MEDFNKIFEKNKIWNFKKAMFKDDKALTLARWLREVKTLCLKI